MKKIIIQVVVAAIFYTLLTVVLSGDYSQTTWETKGIRGLFFGGIYLIYLLLKEKFKKKKANNEI